MNNWEDVDSDLRQLEKNGYKYIIIDEVTLMEKMILLETKMVKSKEKVFKLQFAIGEFDMVVADPTALTCEIYEVKYSKEQVPEQYRHITNEEKCKMTAHRYGEITGRFVICRGESTMTNGIEYLNVEEYLSGLKK